MQLILKERFQRDLVALSSTERQAVFDAVSALPQAVRDPHRHGGLGVRKLHPSGIFEGRAGLRLRIIFGVREDTIVLDRVGSHDDVTRYLRTL